MTSVDAAQDHIHSISSKRSSIHLAIPPSFLSLLLLCFSSSYHHPSSIHSFLLPSTGALCSRGPCTHTFHQEQQQRADWLSIYFASPLKTPLSPSSSLLLTLLLVIRSPSMPWFRMLQ
ncbi:hypothetical protein CRENBAI_001603 [Crenichthys baileyi]|uniref:Uncharacterized protein n=1 Tax=Crenichthys baileyi TaxID=28760 RepID=A0AAV9SL56_9TELE